MFSLFNKIKMNLNFFENDIIFKNIIKNIFT
jgi:hypothetical protein